MSTEWKSEGFRNRFQEAIYLMTGRFPPRHYVDDWLDSDDIELQHFCAEHARLPWLTGIGIIEAADLLVEGAYENANIGKFGEVY